MTQQELQEALDHENILKSIRVVLNRPEGRQFIKYLFKTFNALDFPPVGMNDRDLLEFMSFLRAGNSIFKIVLEASPELTGGIISEIEKERQDEKAHFANESNGRN
jgi:uracil phosphoribosyltransferase